MRLIEHTSALRCGYSESEVEELRAVFDAYDKKHSGLLEAREYSALFADLGLAPKTKQESEALGALIASCRKESTIGPVQFTEFLALARSIDGENESQDT